MDPRLVEYRIAKKELAIAIEATRQQCFEELCAEADVNPWGAAYQIVMRRMRCPRTAPERSPEKLRHIVDALFPQHQQQPWPLLPVGPIPEEIPSISEQELLSIVQRWVARKAPVLDGIPNVAAAETVRTQPAVVRAILQRYLEEGQFPEVWKQQRLVLIPKAGKPPNDPSAYRPICMLDAFGKLYERVITNRLTEFSEGANGLSGLQYGFRKNRSTIDAIRYVIEQARPHRNRYRYGGRFFGLVTLDVRNAFNSASWGAIALALRRMQVPDYLYRVIGDYFSNRLLLYETNEGVKRRTITAGVPQGSVLGPILWNIMYDAVLRLDLSEGCGIVGFADDIVVTVVADDIPMLNTRAEVAVQRIQQWMSSVQLQLALQKTELLVFHSQHRSLHELAKISVYGVDILEQPAIRYLGVTLDTKITFKQHLETTAKKAVSAFQSLNRIISNRRPPRSSIKRILVSVVENIIRYGAPVWQESLRFGSYQAILQRAHKPAVNKVACAFSNVSYDAACVIAGVVPIHLVIREDARCYEQRHTGRDPKEVRREMKAETMTLWQEQWNAAEHGHHTRECIPDITRWTSRKHGEVNRHLTQILSGFGFLRAYQHRVGNAESPTCPTCPAEQETADHVLRICPRFDEERRPLRRADGSYPTLRELCDDMCASEVVWQAACSTTRNIMTRLQQSWNRESPMPSRRRQGQ